MISLCGFIDIFRVPILLVNGCFLYYNLLQLITFFLTQPSETSRGRKTQLIYTPSPYPLLKKGPAHLYYTHTCGFSLG